MCHGISLHLPHLLMLETGEPSKSGQFPSWTENGSKMNKTYQNIILEQAASGYKKNCLIQVSKSGMVSIKGTLPLLKLEFQV